MTEIKYIYYEIYSVEGGSFPIERRLQNENILLIKPETNSDGFWGFRNVTKRNLSGSIPERFSTVEQNWIDFEKYKFGNTYYSEMDEQINMCLDKFKPYIRDIKLSKLGI